MKTVELLNNLAKNFDQIDIFALKPINRVGYSTSMI